MKGDWGKSYINLIALLVIVAGVFSGFLLVRNTQLISSSALTPSAVGNISVFVDDPKNGISKVDIKFKTGSENGQSEAISTVAFKMNVKTKSGKTVTMVDQDGQPVEKMATGENINADKKWEVPVNMMKNVGNSFDAELMAVDTDKAGYDSTNSEVLVSFYVKGITDKSDLNFDFDKDQSVMYSKRRPVTNIWGN